VGAETVLAVLPFNSFSVASFCRAGSEKGTITHLLSILSQLPLRRRLPSAASVRFAFQFFLSCLRLPDPCRVGRLRHELSILSQLPLGERQQLRRVRLLHQPRFQFFLSCLGTIHLYIHLVSILCLSILSQLPRARCRRRNRSPRRRHPFNSFSVASRVRQHRVEQLLVLDPFNSFSVASWQRS
jgi:hypothetical protein